MRGARQAGHDFVELEAGIGGNGKVHGIGNARRQRIVGLGYGNAHRYRAKATPQRGMQPALDDPDRPALQLGRSGERLLAEQMPCAIIDKAAGHEALLRQPSRQIGSCRATNDPPEMAGITKQEGQVEKLQFRHPGGKGRDSGEACLDGTEARTFGHLLFSSECCIGHDVEAEAPRKALLHPLGDPSPDEGFGLVLSQQRGDRERCRARFCGPQNRRGSQQGAGGCEDECTAGKDGHRNTFQTMSANRHRRTSATSRAA